MSDHRGLRLRVLTQMGTGTGSRSRGRVKTTPEPFRRQRDRTSETGRSGSPVTLGREGSSNERPTSLPPSGIGVRDTTPSPPFSLKSKRFRRSESLTPSPVSSLFCISVEVRCSDVVYLHYVSVGPRSQEGFL